MNANEPQLPVALDPIGLLDKLATQGVDPDKLGKLIDLAEKWKADRARESYSVSMAQCQGQIPVVPKKLRNQQKNSDYAPLEDVQSVAMPVITRHGFSVSFSQDAEPCSDGRHHIVMDIHHSEGHSQRLHGYYRLDGKGAKGGEVMSDIQGDVSTHTYAQRDMLRMAFSIQVGGLDNDGQPKSDAITEDQVKEINELIKTKKLDADAFGAWLKTWTGTDKISELNQKQAAKTIDSLRRKS